MYSCQGIFSCPITHHQTNFSFYGCLNLSYTENHGCSVLVNSVYIFFLENFHEDNVEKQSGIFPPFWKLDFYNGIFLFPENG